MMPLDELLSWVDGSIQTLPLSPTPEYFCILLAAVVREKEGDSSEMSHWRWAVERKERKGEEMRPLVVVANSREVKE